MDMRDRYKASAVDRHLSQRGLVDWENVWNSEFDVCLCVLRLPETGSKGFDGAEAEKGCLLLASFAVSWSGREGLD